MDPFARKLELEEIVRKEQEAYHNGTPIVTDDVYDAHVDELADLDALSTAVRSVGATPVSEWPKVKHGIPMGSLNKVNELHEMTEWVTTNCPGETLLVTEKLDGISIHLKYVAGKFTQAITRGDGYVGENITPNVAKMKGIPQKLPVKFTGSVRGEVMLLKSDLKEWFPEYSNSRNGANGVAKRYDGKGSEHLTVFCYRVSDGKDFATEEEQFKFLTEMRFNVPTWTLSSMTVGVKTPHDIWVEYQQTRRNRLDYDIDGLVINVNDLAKQIALGEKDLRPKGCVAFKFAQITRETVIRKVIWQTGGTGQMTPVAEFDPINLLGAQVTNASLYNYKYIVDLKVDVGARVLVARANDVIPRVVSVVKGTGTILPPPHTCDSCGATPVQDGAYYMCPNSSGCPAQVTGRLSTWISELNVLDFGDGLIEKLVAAGKVKNVPDLYRLKVEDISALDRLGEKSATKALGNLKAKSPLPLENFLGGLSIPGVATSTIKLLMEAGYDTLDSFRALTAAQMAAVRGMGPERTGTLHKWLQANAELLDDLATVLPIKAVVKGILTGKTFCFTGSSKLPRAELESRVLAQGGVVKSSVTKNLNYLVMADPNIATVKATAAKKNGTQCISEERLLEMVG